MTLFPVAPDMSSPSRHGYAIFLRTEGEVMCAWTIAPPSLEQYPDDQYRVVNVQTGAQLIRMA